MLGCRCLDLRCSHLYVGFLLDGCSAGRSSRRWRSCWRSFGASAGASVDAPVGAPVGVPVGVGAPPGAPPPPPVGALAAATLSVGPISMWGYSGMGALPGVSPGVGAPAGVPVGVGVPTGAPPSVGAPVGAPGAGAPRPAGDSPAATTWTLCSLVDTRHWLYLSDGRQGYLQDQSLPVVSLLLLLRQSFSRPSCLATCSRMASCRPHASARGSSVGGSSRFGQVSTTVPIS